MDSLLNTFAQRLEKQFSEALAPVKATSSDFMAELKLEEQDAIWQKMFEENPQINLFPLCLDFFREIKQDMDDDVLFHQWLENQKRKYPHRLAYQRIKL